ncbi:MAG: chorismate mutase [Deltaproteobacteria bacterium]|nr:chorismate mutase [Deltaproteobacteria bacterium]
MCGRMQVGNKLGRLRGQIDALDRRIVRMLNARGRLAMRMVEHKQARPARIPARERQVLAHVAALGRGPISPTRLRAIYKAIMRACLAVQVEAWRYRSGG